MKFYTKDFFSKCDQICRKLWIWKLSHLLRKCLMKNCSAVWCSATLLQWRLPWRKNSGYRNIPKDRSSRLEVFCKEGVLSSKNTFVLKNTSGGCFRKELPRTLKSLDMISKERCYLDKNHEIFSNDAFQSYYDLFQVNWLVHIGIFI